jgi:predicted nucleic acid-binding protein
MRSPLRVMIDTMVVDKLAMDPEVEVLMRGAVTSGRLVLVATALRRDQVERAPLAKRETLVRFVADLTVQTTTAGLSLDLSRWGESELATETQVSTIDATRIGHRRHSADALILATAQREGIPLVTEEKGRLRRACLGIGVEVMTADELIALVKLL